MLHFPDIQISNIQISKESVGIISHGFVYMTAMMELNETSLELNSGKKISENVWCNENPSKKTNWVVVSNIFYFQPYLGKWSNLTNIFQLGWNHQLAKVKG